MVVVVVVLLLFCKQVWLMSEIMTAIKFIKLYAWEKSFARAVAGLPFYVRNKIAVDLRLKKLCSRQKPPPQENPARTNFLNILRTISRMPGVCLNVRGHSRPEIPEISKLS